MSGPIQWNSVSLDRTSHFLSRKIVIFAHVQQHLNAMLSSCLIAIFMLTTNGPRSVITCSRCSPEVTLGSYQVQVWEKVENNACPSPLIIRFFSLKTRETWEGTSYQMVRLVCRHFAADERFARQYRHEPLPEFLLSCLFQAFSRVFPRVVLKPLSGSRSVAGVHVCVRVCLCIVYVVRCCACGKTLKTKGNREKCVWYGVCVVWCCEVRNTQKTRETLGKLSKHGLHLWHGMATHGPKKGPKLAIFPNALFLRLPWDLPTILDRGPNPNAQKRRFSTEVLFQRS